ncbi:unnamed protein product [Enterobius vermicularis]|uniref:MFS domain-containing protein n=1 Tax=Enterobius vermicularis TaxID=51028 RepID=A0A0N4V2P8_ENTVE|nr:unnamed protein product [Enterobius vermicularis]
MGKFPSLKLLLVSVVVSFGSSFHFGYQLVITNPSQAAFIDFLNRSYELFETEILQTIWSIIVAILFAGAICGALSIGFVSTKFGRKRGLYVSIGCGILAVLLAIISCHVISFELYIVSRIILGFAVALGLGLSAMLFNESSPRNCRGFVSMMTGIMVQFGTFIGAIIAMPLLLGTTDRWWYIYLIEIIILCIVMALLPFIPESPAYLIQRGYDEAARNAVLFYYGCKVGAVDGPLNEIKENVTANAKKLSVIAVFKDHYSRKGVIVGIVVSFAMSFSGVADNKCQKILYLKSFVVADRFGRRPLVLISLSILLVLNLVIFVLMFCFEEFQLQWIGYFLVVIIALFLFFFAIGVGPVSFFVAAETVGQAARGTSQSCSSMTQMICRLVILMIFYPISDAITQPITYLILFVIPVFLSILFLYSNMPETKNKDHKKVGVFI